MSFIEADDVPATGGEFLLLNVEQSVGGEDDVADSGIGDALRSIVTLVEQDYLKDGGEALEFVAPVRDYRCRRHD